MEGVFMQDMQVFYFTKTGRSQMVAKSIADKFGVLSNQIIDKENWDGVVGFLKGGAKASKEERTEIKHAAIEEGKEIVLVFPVWAGKFPPAVNAFMEGVDRSIVTLVATSLGTKIKDREGYKKVIDLVGKDISGMEIDI